MSEETKENTSPKYSDLVAREETRVSAITMFADYLLDDWQVTRSMHNYVMFALNGQSGVVTFWIGDGERDDRWAFIDKEDGHKKEFPGTPEGLKACMSALCRALQSTTPYAGTVRTIENTLHRVAYREAFNEASCLASTRIAADGKKLVFTTASGASWLFIFTLETSGMWIEGVPASEAPRTFLHLTDAVLSPARRDFDTLDIKKG